jgi:hypothetical protein
MMEDGSDPEEIKEPICPVTGTYCSGMYCDDYGCAKQAGFYDDDEDDYL